MDRMMGWGMGDGGWGMGEGMRMGWGWGEDGMDCIYFGLISDCIHQSHSILHNLHGDGDGNGNMGEDGHVDGDGNGDGYMGGDGK